MLHRKPVWLKDQMTSPLLRACDVEDRVRAVITKWLIDEDFLEVCPHCRQTHRTQKAYALEIDQKRIARQGPMIKGQPRRRSSLWFSSDTLILSVLKSFTAECAPFWWEQERV